MDVDIHSIQAERHWAQAKTAIVCKRENAELGGDTMNYDDQTITTTCVKGSRTVSTHVYRLRSHIVPPNPADDAANALINRKLQDEH